MNNFNLHKIELEENGFSIIENCFHDSELNKMIHIIKENKFDFSERQLLNRFPKLEKIIFRNKSFSQLVSKVCGKDYFLSKAIYFNKPSKSNWFVSYHQDLSISVKKKIDVVGFDKWTNKNGQIGVVPPLNILESSFTFRIHLDKTGKKNGALKVISKSHKKGIIRIDDNSTVRNIGEEIECEIDKGGVMLMKPLLLHSSKKSISEDDRRVIHLEFCNQKIPMQWLEKKVI